MMKFIFPMLALLAATEAVSYLNLTMGEWHSFKLQHNKTYNNKVEERFRLKIFMDNKNKIARHNARFYKGEVSFKLGLNKYSDRLHEEFVSTMNGFKRSDVTMENMEPSTFIEPANVQLPKTVDWRTKGAVTPVKDQGDCASCWAFSSTGALEGQHFRKTGKLVSLSEQNLMDCSMRYGNNGCDGGLMDNSFRYIKDNHGVDTEQSYPYEGKDDTCRYEPKNSGATDSGYVTIPEGDEGKLMAAVATKGPVSVAIDASHESFGFYKEGIYYEPDCGSRIDNLDHGVLVVGYGTENGEDYWLVKNSWGEGWGENGYMKLSRNKHNHCGIATEASYPLV